MSKSEIRNKARISKSDCSKTIRASENPALRRVIVFCGGALIWIGVDLGLPAVAEASSLRRVTTYLLPIFGGGTMWLLFRFARQGVARTAGIIAAAGIAFIVGGAAFDLSVTLLKDPYLSREANPYLRVLLDTRHPLGFVYAYLAVTQAVFVVSFCMIWWAFLRHLPILLDTIVAAGPSSRIGFLKAATGGAHLTTRQWLLPLKMSELPILYHTVWSISIAIVFGISLFRWYVALEWLDVVRAAFGPRAMVVMAGVSGSMAIYFVVLWSLYQSRLAAGESEFSVERDPFPSGSL